LLKKLLRGLGLILVPFVGSLIIRFLAFTNKKIYNTPPSFSEEPLLFACWHGELLMLPIIYTKFRKEHPLKVIISSHFDGKLIAKTISYFKVGSLAGSTNRNAARVLIQAIKSIKDGIDIAITPDGPKGPRREVADGIIIMAQKTNTKIILVEVKPTSFWQLNSWDKFVIPKPFGEIHFYASQEIDVSGLSLEEARDIIKKGLLAHE